MKKLLKIGIPILVVVLVLVIGAGLVLAKENDTSVWNCPYASYDCSQCPVQQYANCPFVGNGGEGGDCLNSCSCQGSGASYGFGNNSTGYQPPCHR